MSANRTTKPKKTKAAAPAPADEAFAGLPPGAVDLDAMPTPPLVAEMMARAKPRKKDRRGQEDEYKLSYYYGGLTLAARVTKKRFIVLAAGVPGEGVVRAALEAATPHPGERFAIFNPDPIEDYLDELRMPHPPAGD